MSTDAENKDKRGLYLELLILSMLSLYIELFAIRWLSADIRAFTVFRTFPLIACFVGMGIGFARGNDKSFRLLPAALLMFALMMKVADLVQFTYFAFPSASVFQFQELALTGAKNPFLYLIIFMVGLIFLLAGPFLSCLYVATRLGVLFNSLPALPAYAVNLMGAGLGSICFTLLAFLGAPPWLLLAIVCAVLLIYSVRDKNWPGIVLLLLAPYLASLPGESRNLPWHASLLAQLSTEDSTIWSPYQRIDLTTFKLKNDTQNPNICGLELGVNRAFYQYFIDDDLDRKKIPKELAEVVNDRHSEYDLPYQIQPKVQDVLIVGSGTGQNAVPAVKHHATDIDAVEIDPRILGLGEKYDPYYHNPAVHLICDDARHFFNTCNKKYDLIVFSLLDSQTVAGQGSSVRLDSYVYTKESYERALSLLKPGGVLFLSFAPAKPWIASRLYETLKAAYGKDVLVLGRKSGSLQPGQALVCNAPPDYQSRIEQDKWQTVPGATGQGSHSVLTDNWPYLYVEPDVIDWPYFLVVAEVVCIALFCARQSIFSKGIMPIYWQMFFLGSGFLLLELESIARLSLLFGSTWLTSAIVINGVLMLILSANGIVIKFQAAIARQQKIIYAGLFIALLASFLLPQNSIMALSTSLGPAAYGVITMITLLPMFFAGLIFPSAFGRVDSPPKALTFNLLGSVIGGLLEYSSYYLGNNGLIAVSALLYACSFFCFLSHSKRESLVVK